jgi:hypothetical protein
MAFVMAFGFDVEKNSLYEAPLCIGFLLKILKGSMSTCWRGNRFSLSSLNACR